METEKKGRSHRSTASFGKRQEYAAIAQLLYHGFDVYLTLVDDQQIDCVVRLDGDYPTYLDLQIKARSNQTKTTLAGRFKVTLKKARKNYFYIFFDERAKKHWIIPSVVIAKDATPVKGDPMQYRLKLIKKTKDKYASSEKWRQYEDNWNILRGFAMGSEDQRFASEVVA